MDYEAMWNELKAKLNKDLDYYEDGSQCSFMEAINGASNAASMLLTMVNLEKKYSRGG